MCSTTDSVRPLLFLPSNWTCCVCQLNTPISWLPKHTVNWAYAWMTWVNVLSSGSWKGRAFLCQGSETLWPEKKWTAKITEGGLAALRLPLCGSDLQIKSLKVRNLSNRLLQVALFCVTITKTWAFSSCLEFSLSLIELFSYTYSWIAGTIVLAHLISLTISFPLTNGTVVFDIYRVYHFRKWRDTQL